MHNPPVKSILIVDDDPAIREMLADLLFDDGYNVRTVPDGLVALDLLRAQPARFGLILLDLNMPRLTGWEFRTRQRADPAIANIPVVVISAATNTGEQDQRADLVPDVFLPKPLDSEKLQSYVERFIGVAG